VQVTRNQNFVNMIQRDKTSAATGSVAKRQDSSAKGG
jgi:hypothetical protein